MDGDECSGCGSDFKDRRKYKEQNGNDEGISLETKNCPHCGCMKCCMCDMGDDVACVGCTQGD